MPGAGAKSPPPASSAGALTTHIQQADQGADSEFPRTDFDALLPQPVIY